MNRVVDGIYTDRQNKTKQNNKQQKNNQLSTVINCYQVSTEELTAFLQIIKNKTKQLQLIISLFFNFFKWNQQPQEMCLA